MTDALHRQWLDLFRVWAVPPSLADPSFDELCGRYASAGRFYHTLDHVQNVLETVEQLGRYASNLNAVKLAAWLHDLIYDSRASDNEERSADYAERLCTQFAIPEGQRVAALIRKTKTHEAGEDADALVLLDADLAILGAGESAYRDYSDKIRQEYAWVPDSDYRRGRRRVMQNFLSRPRIFHFLCDLEERARRNIAAEVARLAT